MKIVLLYNQVERLTRGNPEDILADEDSVKSAREIQSALTSLGHSVELFRLTTSSVTRLSSIKADIIFNQAFGVGSLPKTEHVAAAALEKLRIPFTGSASQAIILTTDKFATKNLLEANHLPTPRSQLFISCREKISPALTFPLIAKPSSEDCSLGIDETAVFDKADKLRRKMTALCKIYSEPVLVEEYIDGRELNVTVIGNGAGARVLPVSEILFGHYFDGKYKVINFAAKWKEDSPDYQNTLEAICPAKLAPEVFRKIEDICLQAYQLSGCRDYARIDLRLNNKDQPFILEVNANPGIGPGDGAARSARAAGLSYPKFLQQIADYALDRAQN